MMGPIDYIVVGFKGNFFDGSVLKALHKAVESGVIRVVDLVLITKDAVGEIHIAEIEDQADDLKDVAKLIGHTSDMPLFTEDDLKTIAEKMDPDSSAGVLVIEHLWAIELKTALLHVRGVLLDEGRIHPEKVEAAVAELQQQQVA
jgi:hypothetical protein